MKPFLDPPPVEELSELDWRRLEQNVLSSDLVSADRLAAHDYSRDNSLGNAQGSSLDNAHSSRRRIAIGGGLATLVAAAAVVLLVHQWNTETPQLDRSPSRLVTTTAPSVISVGNATMRADIETALVVSEDRFGTQIVLEYGAVDCTEAPRTGRAPFLVLAGDVRVEVVGTKFRVERVGGSATVSVERGRVRVTAAGELIELEPGERWPVVAAIAPKTPSVETPSVETPSVETPSVETPTDHKTASSTKRPTISAKERYALAARLESKSPAKAIAIYRRLANKGGPWAANALFAMGRLEIDRGNTRRGNAYLRRYIKKHPAGANAADAKALLNSPR